MSRPVPENIQINKSLFRKRLQEEIKLLEEWFSKGLFAERKLQAGLETEYFLVDQKSRLSGKNLELLDRINYPRIVPELENSQIEINSEVVALEGSALSQLHKQLDADYARCLLAAGELGIDLMAVGIFPNALEGDYITDTHTDVYRYELICSEIPSENCPFSVYLEGTQRLEIQIPTLKGLANAFQIHFRVDLAESLRYYNAAIALAAPIIAACGNAPMICGKQIAAESRVPYFEKTMPIFTPSGSSEPSRCILGEGYVKESLLERFHYNIRNFRTLLPATDETSPEQMLHIMYHNGTIYHWIRPIIDFGPSGLPHLRLEFRPLSSGPTHVDMIANAALFFGLVHFYANQELTLESEIPFKVANRNFYRAAAEGLDATLTWREEINATDLLLNHLIPHAYEGLNMLGCDTKESIFYLNIIEERTKSGQTGSSWQLKFLEKHPKAFAELVKEYLIHQKADRPVHTWD